MRFDLNDDQQTIDRTVRELLAARLTPERLRASLDAGAYDDALWRELAELGFAGIAVPAAYGGQGLGLLELGLVAEAVGYALAPVPFIATAAAGLVIAAAGDEAQREGLLPELAAGERSAALSVLGDGVDPLTIDGVGASIHIAVDGGRVSLHGAGDGLEVTPAPTIDLLRRYARVHRVGEGEWLAGDPARAIHEVQVMLAAELTGVAQRALDLAVAYAGEREQFGRLIGSFQGVSHRCVGALLAVETARSTWRYGAWAATSGDDELALAASTAKVAAAEASWKATADCLQIFGGIGFTWEHDVHLLLRRARTVGQVLGSATEHRRRVAAILREQLRDATSA